MIWWRRFERFHPRGVLSLVRQTACKAVLRSPILPLCSRPDDGRDEWLASVPVGMRILWQASFCSDRPTGFAS